MGGGEATGPGRAAQKYVLSVGAACVAELLTFPLDLVKTRLQVQGEMAGGGASGRYRGMAATLTGVVREEGPAGLWRGVGPGIARHAIYSGVRMTLYDWMRGVRAAQAGELRLVDRAGLGMTAGALGQLVASPTDLVKVRMQMEGRQRLAGLPGRGEGAAQLLVRAVREGGLRSLWAGAVPNMQRAALVNLGDLTTYDQAKRWLVDERGLAADHWTTHGLASGCAGLAAAALGTPADVVKARVMNQPVDPRTGRGLHYSGSLDCLARAVRQEGVASLWKGFLPCWLRMAPWSLIFWLTFEKMRTVAGLQPW